MKGLPILSVIVVMLCGAPCRPEDSTIALPPIEAAKGLPSHKWCQEFAKVAEEQRQWVADRCAEAKMDSYPAYYFQCDNAAWAWYWAEKATDPKRDVLERRGALRGLVDLVGWRAVLTGELPHPIPPEE